MAIQTSEISIAIIKEKKMYIKDELGGDNNDGKTVVNFIVNQSKQQQPKFPATKILQGFISLLTCWIKD
ncbi:hypothetical protein CHUAL_000139 [Chamberlinius hualienensis]